MSEIVSPQTRRAFQESYVNFSVLRNIATDFDDAGVARADVPATRRPSGQRRLLVAEYYETVDWTSPGAVRRVLDAYEGQLSRLAAMDYSEDAQKELARLTSLLQRDGLSYRDGAIDFVAHGVGLDELVDHEVTVDLSQLRKNAARIRDSVDDDPALAIGSSKELVKAACKAVLTELGADFPPRVEIPELVHLVGEHLDLLAADVPSAEAGARSLKRVLGSLSNLVQGLDELRHLYGAGHGKGPSDRTLEPRHARLCAAAASALSQFLMETAIQRATGRSNPGKTTSS